MDIEQRPPEGLEVEDPIKRQLRSILKFRGKERMDAILESEHAREIFQAIPEEEAYFTIKEIGEQDALPLLSLMSGEQCQHLLDLELWTGYEFQMEKLDHWLPLLLSCEEEAIDHWLRTIDVDTILLILKKNIRVHLKGTDDAVDSREETDSWFTLDGSYFVEFLNPSNRATIELLLRRIAQCDLNFYWRLLEQAQWELDAELEERALHFRNARLEDRGFPPMDVAVSLYQYLNAKRLNQMLEQKEIHLPALTEVSQSLSFPMLLRDQGMFFSACLRNIEQGGFVDRIKMELAYIANQVIVADRPEDINVTILERSLAKAGGYLSIGLEIMSEGDPDRAMIYLEQVPLKYLFQVGFGATLELKWKAEKIWKKGFFAENRIPLSFLGSPWEETVAGLLKKRPEYFSASTGTYREFRSIGDVRSIERELDWIGLLKEILTRLPNFVYRDGLTWKDALLKSFLDDLAVPMPDEAEGCPIDNYYRLKRLASAGANPRDSLNLWISERLGPTLGNAPTINRILDLLLDEPGLKEDFWLAEDRGV